MGLRPEGGGPITAHNVKTKDFRFATQDVLNAKTLASLGTPSRWYYMTVCQLRVPDAPDTTWSYRIDNGVDIVGFSANGFSVNGKSEMLLAGIKTGGYFFDVKLQNGAGILEISSGSAVDSARMLGGEIRVTLIRNEDYFNLNAEQPQRID